MLENVDRILGRMQQIERRLDSGNFGSADFQLLMDQKLSEKKPTDTKKANALDAAMAGHASLGKMNLLQSLRSNPNLSSVASGAAAVVPLAQSNSVSCGQTSVAMCINALTGKDLRDTDIDARYGFGLMKALNEETRTSGYEWKDNGDLSASSWDLIDHKVNVEKLPVIVGLNGPEFSISGMGHIVTIIKTEGDKVTYADPADGQIKTTTKQNMNTAPSHPDGNFVFYSNQAAPVQNQNILPFS